ncbi:MAG: hypothetical protein ACXVUX_14455 [Solirubrobacteraceae bacterium]
MSHRLDATTRRALAGLRAPDEAGAHERAWATVRAAYVDRPAPAPARRRRRIAAVPLVAVLIGAVAFSPAGATVKRIINRAFSVPHVARMAGLSLPGPGSVLVSDRRGTWVVSNRGSVRRLGGWTQANWSPRGLYVAVASAGALAAIDPSGGVAWRLPERGVSDPRWYPPSGYRVAYRSGGDLRVVAGDGSGDHPLARHVAPVAPAWRPGHPFQLAYVARDGAIVVQGGDSGVLVWRSGPHQGRPLELSWSPTGTRLVLVTSAGVWLYLPGQSPPLTLRLPVRGPVVAAAASPDGRRLALVRGGTVPQLQLADLTAPEHPARTVLGVAVEQPTWSPDSRWLLVTESASGPWLFVRAAGQPRIVAEARVANRFGALRSGPIHVDGWCCGA